MVRCADGSLYTGISTDEHNGGTAAKYTRGRRPVHLVYHELASSHSAAARREAQIKKLSRLAKEALIAASKA
jgi:putative endonuclease